MRRASIVLADANETVRSVAAHQLMACGHTVREVSSASSAISRLQKNANDLIIVDFDLPDILGLDLLREIKTNQRFGSVRVLMTSDNGQQDAVAALESGADDYIEKPYSLSELLARVSTALRRPAVLHDEWGTRRVGAIVIDDVRHQAVVKNQPVELSPLEYKLLHFFVENPDQMFSRQHLLIHVWSRPEGVSTRTVDVNVRRLRSRLAPFNCEHYIQTVRGCGYRFSIKHLGGFQSKHVAKYQRKI